jgi:peptidase M28-like protein/PDZ domain-containing protein/PA domain-containing protein
MSTRRISLSIFAIAFLLTSASLSLNPANAALEIQSQKSAQSDAQISAERIARHIAFLASDKLQGRRSGTPGADEAARYIAAEFRSYGLKPASADGFLQPFTFVAGVRLGPKSAFQIKDSSGSHQYEASKDFMPLAFSSQEMATGEAVFASYGISAPELQYDNYTGIDAKGKIVLILRGSPDGDNPHGRFAEFTQPGLEIQNKTLKAREKGARGVIFISEEKIFPHDRLSRLHHDLNFLDAGIPAIVISRETANAILNRSASLKRAAAEASAEDAVGRAKTSGSSFAIEGAAISFKGDVIKINGNGSNVAGILTGSDPRLASEYVAIGAHYDHLGLGGPESLAAIPEGQIHHGADDNASGTAGLLELARTLAQNRGALKRSVIFIAFSGEELGLLGSGAYTKTPLAPLASTVAMLNMDMIGRLRNGALFIGGVGTSPAWKPLIEKLNAQSGSGGSENGSQSRFQLSFGQDGFGPSDHQSFYVKDIPVLFFFTGSHDDYHKPSDTADKINSEGLKQVAGLVGEVAASVANEPERIAFNRVKVETKPTGGGFRVYLGTVPNYSDQSDGMKLDGVRPGSPAERAGLKAGDLVMKLNKMPIKNVYDYTYALGELRPGEEVEIQVRRDGREVNLKITPDRRQ